LGKAVVTDVMDLQTLTRHISAGLQGRP